MKNFLSVMCLLITFVGASAQDLMIKNNGDEIKVKVLEITNDNVKYKKHTNIDGPLYTVSKSEVKEIIFENGDKEVFINANAKSTDSRKAVFIKTTVDSKVHPTQKVWKEEIERSSNLKKVNSPEESDLIFEFRIRRAMGEARVSVVVYDSDNKKLWESKKYRGTANIYNRMGASLHAIRRCMTKGIIPEMEKGTF